MTPPLHFTQSLSCRFGARMARSSRLTTAQVTLLKQQKNQCEGACMLYAKQIVSELYSRVERVEAHHLRRISNWIFDQVESLTLTSLGLSRSQFPCVTEQNLRKTRSH